MKRNFLLSGMAVSLLTAGMNVSAQDNDKPWHVIVYNTDTVETASFNVEALEDIALSTDGATVTFKLDNGKQFPYSTTTTLFGFEPRPKGSGTANEVVQINPWSVSYGNGVLHLSEASSADGNIYNMTGIRVGSFARGQKDIPINLASGLYIVQSGRNTAKIFVRQNETGGAIATSQPTAATKQAVVTLTITTRAAEVFKTWMNITHGDANHLQKTPIQMDLVAYWKFTLDGIEFLMKDGNTIKIMDFKGLVFDISPIPPQTNGWDMEKTIKFGGASYGVSLLLSYGPHAKLEYISVVHSKGVIIYDVQANKEIKISNSDIAANVWTDNADKARILSVGTNRDSQVLPSICHVELVGGDNHLRFVALTTGSWVIGSPLSSWLFNGNTNVIPSTIIQNADGSITIEATDADGIKLFHTFIGW